MPPLAGRDESAPSTVRPTKSEHVRWAGRNAIGTTVRLVVTDEPQLGSARVMLTDDLTALDAACSRFRAESELMQFDTSADQPNAISPRLATATRATLRGSQLTDGDVDTTLGRAMETIECDHDFASMPAQGGALQVTVRDAPRWRQIKLDETTGQLTMPVDVRLDLEATAKAWGADRPAQRIPQALSCGVLVSLGSDIAVAGEVPPGGWAIRVQDVTGDPMTPSQEPAAVIVIHTGGLATSTTSARSWQCGGDLMHHILGPRTGRPTSQQRMAHYVSGGYLSHGRQHRQHCPIIRGRSALGWLTQPGLPARLVAVDGSVTTLADWPEVSS